MLDTTVASWFIDTASLSITVASIVALIRKSFVQIDGKPVIMLSLAVGVLLGLLGSVLGLVPGGLAEGAAFGFTAGVGASGGMAALISLFRPQPAVLIEAEKAHVDTVPPPYKPTPYPKDGIPPGGTR